MLKGHPVESQGTTLSTTSSHVRLPQPKLQSRRNLYGLFRSDGKHPDGLTLIPWQRGLSLTWDVTVATTLADSYISASASSAGAAAEMAASRKQAKYAALSGSYVLQPIALETLGPIKESDVQFLNDMGQRITSVSTGDKEAQFLFPLGSSGGPDGITPQHSRYLLTRSTNDSLQQESG